MDSVTNSMDAMSIKNKKKSDTQFADTPMTPPNKSTTDTPTPSKFTTDAPTPGKPSTDTSTRSKPTKATTTPNKPTTPTQPATTSVPGIKYDSKAESKTTEGEKKTEKTAAEHKQPEKKLKLTPNLKQLLDKIKDGTIKDIVLMVGAGISVSAGIPDFRSPQTGLYANLQKYNLPTPEAIFDIGYLRKEPKAFNTLAKELYPGEFYPTPTHHFINLLATKGILRRCFSQNIDGLETMANLPEDKLMQAHGGFSFAHCINCKAEHPTDWVKEMVFSDQIPRCPCQGIVKPDIVFFGEDLPARFGELANEDFPLADCLIVMGTSLQVRPFSDLIHNVDDNCPRILINREKVAEKRKLDMTLDDLPIPHYLKKQMKDIAEDDPEQYQMMMDYFTRQMGGGSLQGFEFSDEGRDIFMEGNCDDAVVEICDYLGGDWSALLNTAIDNYKLPKDRV